MSARSHMQSSRVKVADVHVLILVPQHLASVAEKAFDLHIIFDALNKEYATLWQQEAYVGICFHVLHTLTQKSHHQIDGVELAFVHICPSDAVCKSQGIYHFSCMPLTVTTRRKHI